MKYTLIKTFLIFISFFSVETFSLTNIKIKPPIETYDLIQQSEYYADITGKLNVNDIHELFISGKLKKTEHSPLQLGYTEDTIWVTFSIEPQPLNMNIKENHWYIEIMNPATSYIDIYFIEPSGKSTFVYSGGMSRDPGKLIYHTNYYTDISEYIKKKGTFYIKLRSIFSHVIGARLISDTEFSSEESKQRIIPGIIAGVLFSLFLYNIFIFFSLKDITYFFYAGYMLFGLFQFAPNVGYTKIIFQSHTQLMIFAIQLVTSIWIIFHLLFIKKFLNLPKLQPRINALFNIFITFYALIGIMNSKIPSIIFYEILEVVGLIGLILSIYTAIRSLINGYLPARFFLAGYIVFFTLFAIYLLMMIHIIPVTSFFIYLLIPGIAHAGEATMLSFALADRYRILEKESRAFLEIQKDMDFAVQVQQHLFPSLIPQHPNYNIVGNYIPSNQMSGDFYDIIEDREHMITTVLIADVAGHGYSGSIISAMVKVAFRESYYQTNSISEQIIKMNSILTEIVKDTFITAGILRINCKTMETEYSQAGHMPLVLQNRATGGIELLKPNGIPLGIVVSGNWEKVTFKLKPMDRIFMFTDGLIDCLNVNETEFTLERLLTVIRSERSLSTQTFSEYLNNELRKWDQTNLKHPEDDITYIIIDII